MPNYSNATITGHLGRDPESRAAGNTSVVSFSVAVTTGYGDRKTTTWWNVSIFGKSGEAAMKHLSKGDAVTVSGEAALRPWTDKEGNERQSLDINANQWGFAGSKNESKPKERVEKHEPEFDDDIPF